MIMDDYSKCRMYIVRHGETEWNVEGRLQGHEDAPLTARGIQQAKNRANDLSRIEFDAIFASDLGRTMATAKILKAERELTVIATKLMRERAFGRFEGMKYQEFGELLREKLDERDALALEAQGSYKLHEEIESDDELSTRGLTCIRETALAYLGKSVLMVSHGGMMGALLWKLGIGLDKGKVQRRALIQNLAYFVLETDGVEMEVTQMEGIEWEE